MFKLNLNMHGRLGGDLVRFYFLLTVRGGGGGASPTIPKKQQYPGWKIIVMQTNELFMSLDELFKSGQRLFLHSLSLCWRELSRITLSPSSYQWWASFPWKIFEILIKQPILAKWTEEGKKRVMSLLRHKKHSPHVQPHKRTPKQYLVPTAFIHPVIHQKVVINIS